MQSEFRNHEYRTSKIDQAIPSINGQQLRGLFFMGIFSYITQKG